MVRTLGVATGLVGVGRGGLYAKHGSLVSSKTYRGWFAGLSDSRLVGLASASLVAWHRSSSPRIKYQHKYHTDIYRPLSESTIPIIDRDTDPYRFRLSTKFTDMPTLLTAGMAVPEIVSGLVASGTADVWAQTRCCLMLQTRRAHCVGHHPAVLTEWAPVLRRFSAGALLMFDWSDSLHAAFTANLS